MVVYSTARDYLGFDHNRFLGYRAEIQSCDLCDSLPPAYHFHQLVWRQRVWRRGIRLLDYKDCGDYRIYVSCSYLIAIVSLLT
jgi:hypothetical protein